MPIYECDCGAWMISSSMEEKFRICLNCGKLMKEKSEKVGSEGLKDTDYAEIVIRYTKHMPPTSLHALKHRLTEIANAFIPKLEVRIESVPFGDVE